MRILPGDDFIVRPTSGVVVIETGRWRCKIVCEKKQDWQLAEERRTEQVEILWSLAYFTQK